VVDVYPYVRTDYVTADILALVLVQAYL
jgi:hypothetical protein